MTNGEKLKEIFPNIRITLCESYVQVMGENYEFNNAYPLTWWNSEYKESTTKNDLGVEQDLISTITEKISEQVKESHGQFIFETIRPYCENVVQMKISKRELEQALLKYYGKNDLRVDCIDRAEVLKLMKDNWHTHNGDWAMQESMDDIRALPSVTPQEPRKGHWITRPHVYGVTYCSECNFELKIDNTNYCPNCGADMRGVEE